MVNDPKPDVQEGGDKPKEGSQNPQAKPQGGDAEGMPKEKPQE